MGSSHIATPKGTFFAEARHRTCRSLKSVHPFTIPPNPMLCNGPDTPLKRSPSIGASAPSFNVLFLGSTRRSNPNGIWFNHFCTAHGRASLYFTMGRPFPLQIAFLYGESGTPSNTWFLRPTHGESGTPSKTWFLRLTRVFNPKWHLDRFSRFAGLTIATDRHTDRQTIGDNRPHLRT